MTDRQLVTEGIITLFQLDTSFLGGPVHYFTSAIDFDTVIYWGGQQYFPLPMEANGFEMTSQGALPTPSVVVSNLFGAGNALLDSYRGLVGADLIRILTLRRFLDDGATPDPNAYISRELWVVAQKTAHNAIQIVFKLASRMDQEGAQIPRRQILRDVCSHAYRVWNPAFGFDYSKATCPYTASYSFDVNNNPTDYPNDQCSRSMIGCTVRFGRWAALPARFFPGVGKVK